MTKGTVNMTKGTVNMTKGTVNMTNRDFIMLFGFALRRLEQLHIHADGGADLAVA